MDEREIRKELVILNLQRSNQLSVRELRELENYIWGKELEDAPTPSKA
ncbi:MAG: hypothetical protein PHE89_02760 [Alphaproteobacteria bacterium]|nr:hypothetical protein [Alphaproteobacteria bacterium]